MNRRVELGAADPVKTRRLMEHLLQAFEQFCNEVAEEPVSFIDAFMGAHNIHKAIIIDMADREELQGERRRILLHCAADTFRLAMEQEARKEGN
jgi:hypothetical protein